MSCSLSRAEAAKMLAQMLAADAVGHLLDCVADADLRDRVLKVLSRARDVITDEESAAPVAPPISGR